MIQLVQPNLNAAGSIGFCEEFAERVWNTKVTRPTAIAGWNAIPIQYKHVNQEPPTDVAVQMYWKYQTAGHTATSVPNKGILSSPWEVGTTGAWLSSRAQLEEIYSDDGKYPLTYLGWTEYFNGVLIAEGDNDMATQEQLQVIYYMALPNQPVNQDWVNTWTGKDMSDAVNALRDDPSRQAYITKLVNDAAAYEANPGNVVPYSGPTLYVK